MTAAALGWMAGGQEYLLSCLKAVGDEELAGPSRLPGWSGKHLLSHVGHNARALARLAHGAATGEPTPMYASPTARAEEIETGAAWSPDRLRDFVVAEHPGRVVAEAPYGHRCGSFAVATLAVVDHGLSVIPARAVV